MARLRGKVGYITETKVFLQATLFGERRTLDGDKSEVLNYIQRDLRVDLRNSLHGGESRFNLPLSIASLSRSIITLNKETDA